MWRALTFVCLWMGAWTCVQSGENRPSRSRMRTHPLILPPWRRTRSRTCHCGPTESRRYPSPATPPSRKAGDDSSIRRSIVTSSSSRSCTSPAVRGPTRASTSATGERRRLVSGRTRADARCRATRLGRARRKEASLRILPSRQRRRTARERARRRVTRRVFSARAR